MTRVGRPLARILRVVLVCGLTAPVSDLGALAADAPIADAARHGDVAALRALVESGEDVNAAQSDGATALHWAVYRNDTESTAFLLQSGADVNVVNNYGVSSLALASQNGNAAIIGQLLAEGADPNDSLHAVNANETPLMQAARAGQPEAVGALIDAGAAINATESWNGQSALMWAAAEGHVPVV